MSVWLLLHLGDAGLKTTVLLAASSHHLYWEISAKRPLRVGASWNVDACRGLTALHLFVRLKHVLILSLLDVTSVHALLRCSINMLLLAVQTLEADAATSMLLILELLSLLVGGLEDIWHVDKVNILLVLCLFSLHWVQVVVHLLKVVMMISNDFTSNMAKWTLSWVLHVKHHVLHSILMRLGIGKSLIGVHFVSVLLLFGHIHLRIGIAFLNHSDILSVRSSHSWLHHLLFLLYYKVANR